MRRTSTTTTVALAAIALLIGSASVAWWAVGDLTESEVRDPTYMFTAPDWAAQHPDALAAVGAVLLVAGLLGFGLLVTRRIEAGARNRAFVVQGLLVADGFLVGFVLRLLTVGAEGASFTGLTLLMIAPPVVVVTALLLRSTIRLTRATT
jgi:hypothetical protein